jgi:glycosyltransferase involved in cell wall biosynthesis
MSTKLRVLFKGWIDIPHSYAMVNCFQLIHLTKTHGSRLDIYVDEQPYFKQEWANSKKLVYGEEYNEILRNLKRWKGEVVDVVYSITYPYNIAPCGSGNKEVPKCVFYTSEFAWIDHTYFCWDNLKFRNNDHVKQHLNQHKIHFTSPSVWSSMGAAGLGVEPERNRIITHGIDPIIFHQHSGTVEREKVRSFYKITEGDILLINIGAMTQNKGIVMLLESLNSLINTHGLTQFKLLLKGTGDLYTSKAFVESYLEELVKGEKMSTSQKDTLLASHIIFSDKTLSYQTINDLYNAADLYASPYLAEGFNMTVLESLAAGLPVLVPETGSTREYIKDIQEHGGNEFILQVKSQIGKYANGMCQNVIETADLTSLLIESVPLLNKMKTERRRPEVYQEMRQRIENEYSWSKVAELLYNYLDHISKI